MEWVETTGKTVEEALEAALDQLGVDAADAEYEVLEEAKTGLFGRLRTEARVRARVRPTTPRPKDERRNRGGRKPTSGGGGSRTSSAAPASNAGGDRTGTPSSRGRSNDRRPSGGTKTAAREDDPEVTDT